MAVIISYGKPNWLTIDCAPDVIDESRFCIDLDHFRLIEFYGGDLHACPLDASVNSDMSNKKIGLLTTIPQQRAELVEGGQHFVTVGLVIDFLAFLAGHQHPGLL